MPSKSITVSDLRAVAIDIANLLGTDPRHVSVRGHSSENDGMFRYRAYISRREAHEESGYGRRHAAANLYEVLRERELTLRQAAFARSRRCLGGAARSDTCQRPSLYIVDKGTLRDTIPVRLGRRSVAYPDADLVYAESLNDFVAQQERRRKR